MSDSTRDLDDAVRAVCDGRPVDWAAIEQTATATDQRRLEALRALEEIARLHRSPSLIDTAALGVSASDAEASWGHLQLLEHMASGAFGDVYRAWDPALDREVALKLLRRAPDADAHPEEAVDEGRLLARVHHPNVVTVHGAARLDGKIGLWMELVHGHTLAEVVRRDGPLPAPRVAAIGQDLCAALTAVHGAGLVHRDVKPQNVMLADDGRVVLMDFGAGRDVRHAAFDVVGTPAYLAPEVLTGTPATVTSDIYSVGVLLGFALAGTNDIRAARTAAADVSPALAAIVERAAAENPSDRFESADALREALRAAITPSTRIPWAFYAAAAAVAAAALIVVGILWWHRPPSLEDADQIYAARWRAATPLHNPVPEDRIGRIAGRGGGMNLRGQMAAVTWDEPGVVFGLVNVRTGEWRPFGRVEVPGVKEFSRPQGPHPESLQPSPDSSAIAYVWVAPALPDQSASVRVIDTRGSVRELLSRPDLAAAALGTWVGSRLPVLLATRQGSHELAVLDTSNGALRSAARVERVGGFQLSPDGRYLAYDVPWAPSALERDIVVRDVQTGREWRIASDRRNRQGPVWSPDGRHLFFFERTDRDSWLEAVRVESGRAAGPVQRLRDDIGAVHPLGDWFGFVDRETVYYSKWAIDIDLFVADRGKDGLFDADNARRVSDGWGYSPSWSPDGSTLAWCRGGELVVWRDDGQKPRVYRGGLDDALWPTWSPDGTKIAFLGMESLVESVRLLDVRTGSVTPLLSFGHAGGGGQLHLAWHPSGHLLFVGFDGGRIETVDVRTGTRRLFTQASPRSWLSQGVFVSPDGHALLWGEIPPDLRKIFIRVVPLDGAAQARRFELDHSIGSFFGFAPGGRGLLATRGALFEKGDELVELPFDGSAPRSFGLRADIFHLALSGDGRRVAYTTAAPSVSERGLITPLPEPNGQPQK